MSGKIYKDRFQTAHKLRLACQSWGLRDEKLGRFLRANGISSPELKIWRGQMKDGLEDGKVMGRRDKKQLENRIKLLEEENRQLRILNDLQKKAHAILEAAEARKLAEKTELSGLKLSEKGSSKE